MSSPLSFGLPIDILEYKEMSFVCFCVPCDVIIVIEEALIPIWLAWLAASYMQYCILDPTFLKLSTWNLAVICRIRIKVVQTRGTSPQLHAHIGGRAKRRRPNLWPYG